MTPPGGRAILRPMPRLRPLAAAIALSCGAAHAQIATDGSMGARATLAGPRYSIPDTLGSRRGTNLFHSFSTFNLRPGETATFSGRGSIANIIARVTGGSPSSIQGTLASTLGQANLWLVNPSGIVFGAGARLDLPAAFHASTAHYVALGDGTRFDTTTTSPEIGGLPPVALGFGAGEAAPITASGVLLSVREGRRIALVGGDVTLAGNAIVNAPRGEAILVAAGSGGEVILDGGTVRLEGFTRRSHLVLRDGARVLANEGASRTGSGRVTLRGGDVTLDHAGVESRTRFGAGGAIDIEAAGRLTVDASDVLAVTTGAGDAASLRLAGEDIEIRGASLVDTSCDPGCTTGNGGALTIEARGTLAIRGDSPTQPTYVVSNSFGGGRTGPIAIRAGAFVGQGNALLQGISLAAGGGNTITLDTGSIRLSGGAQVDASSRGGGPGGTITVRNAGGIVIEGTRSDPTQGGLTLASGFFSSTEGPATGGAIVVSTRTLEVRDGGEVSAAARVGSTGPGGAIDIRATESIRVAGRDANGKPAGIVSNTFGAGAAGDVRLEAPAITIESGGVVQATTESTGHGGTLTIRGGTLVLRDGGQVASESFLSGDAGDLDIAMTGDISIGDEGAVAANRFESGIFANANGSGRGGTARISAANLAIRRDGNISSQARSTGDGGSIDIAVSGALTLSDGGQVSAASLDRTDDRGRVPGLAGDIRIHAAGGVSLGAGTQIATSAREADGGNIALATDGLLRMEGGRIATAVGLGQGDGGNVSILAPMMVLRGATISANAFGGDGGNIAIGVANLFRTGDTRITASSQLGIDGVISFESPAIDPTAQLLAPPPVFLDAGAILAGRCGPRLAGRASSLVVVPEPLGDRVPDQLRTAFPASALRDPRAASCAPGPAAR